MDVSSSQRSNAQRFRPLAPRPPQHEHHRSSHDSFSETVDPRDLIKTNSPVKTSPFTEDSVRYEQTLVIKSPRKSDVVQHVLINHKSPKVSAFDWEHYKRGHSSHSSGVVANISDRSESIKHDQGTKARHLLLF